MNDNITGRKDWYLEGVPGFIQPDGKVTVILEEEGRRLISVEFNNTNLDLFVVLDKVLEKKQVNIEYIWVKGHDGNVYNELCDKLCNAVLGYDANAEFEKYKKTGKKEKQSISLEFAWALYNFINNWKAGNYGTIPLQDALDKDFEY